MATPTYLADEEGNINDEGAAVLAFIDEAHHTGCKWQLAQVEDGSYVARLQMPKTKFVVGGVGRTLIAAVHDVSRAMVEAAGGRGSCTCGSGLPMLDGRCPKCFPLVGSRS